MQAATYQKTTKDYNICIYSQDILLVCHSFPLPLYKCLTSTSNFLPGPSMNAMDLDPPPVVTVVCT